MISVTFYKHFAATRLMTTVTLASFLAFSSVPLFASHSDAQAKTIYEVYALSYGVYPNFPVSGLIAGADKTRKIDLQMMVWLVRGGGKNILVDTGCYHENVVKGKGIQNLIKASGIPYTIVRSTQFFEFTRAIAQEATVGQAVRLSPALYQPIAADDVAEAIADAALDAPVNGTIEIAGPERVPLDELVGRYLTATHDPRTVIPDAHATYYGIAVNDQSLTPGDGARIGAIRFADWLQHAVPQR